MQKKLSEKFNALTGKKIAILGLAYKSGTDCLKQSLIIQLSLWLNEQGAILKAYDPILKTLPPTLNKFITLQQDLFSALYQADVVIIGAMWSELLTIKVEQLIAKQQKPYVFDLNGFLSKQLAGDNRIDYYRVGANT